MLFARGVRSILGSSIVNRLFSRPRLVATLLFLVLLVAMQGGAVADGGNLSDGYTVGTNELGATNPGP